MFVWGLNGGVCTKMIKIRIKRRKRKKNDQRNEKEEGRQKKGRSRGRHVRVLGEGTRMIRAMLATRLLFTKAARTSTTELKVGQFSLALVEIEVERDVRNREFLAHFDGTRGAHNTLFALAVRKFHKRVGLTAVVVARKQRKKANPFEILHVVDAKA